MPSTTQCAICGDSIADSHAIYDDKGRLVCDPPCSARRAPLRVAASEETGRKIFIVLTVTTAALTALILYPKGEGYDVVKAGSCAILPVGGWILTFFKGERGLKWLVLLYGALGAASLFILAPLGYSLNPNGEHSLRSALFIGAFGVVSLVLAFLCLSKDLHAYLENR